MLWLLLYTLWAKEATSIQSTEPAVDLIVQESLAKSQVVSGQIKLSNGFTYNVVSEDRHELRHNLNDLSQLDLDIFKRRRIERLIFMAKYLSFNGLTTGIGYVENNQISMIKDGNTTDNLLNIIAGIDNDKDSQSNTGRRHQIITRILDYYDNKTFENSKSFVGSKEYCIDLYLAPMSVMGIGKYIFGGSYGFNIILGYDSKSKRVVFQLKKVVEAAKSGFAFIPLGLNVRFGIYARSLDYGPKNFDVTYIPAVPAYKTNANGVRGGGVSLPVSLLGVLTAGGFTVAENFMAYKGTNHSVTLIDTGFRISFFNLDNLFIGLKSMMTYAGMRRCQSVF
ncbi:MAG: hypothetical protein KDD37_03335 [Bdellovibrionales bacterium]|nr:hypothetical protein [Bdellovibrionales bacterium]